VREFVAHAPIAVTMEHCVARLCNAGIVLLSDVHGYEPVTRANLWLMAQLLAGGRARFLGIEFLYQSWDLRANDLPEHMAVAFPDLQAQGKLFACPHCGGVRRLLAAITDPDAIERVLRAMGLSCEVAQLAPARAPPGEWEWWGA
jgi:hypothetical protein